jgi:uncharacterized protein YchJ
MLGLCYFGSIKRYEECANSESVLRNKLKGKYYIRHGFISRIEEETNYVRQRDIPPDQSTYIFRKRVQIRTQVFHTPFQS